MSFTISYKNLTATISQKGAELISFKKENTEYIWEGNPEFWGKHSPVLFPIVGTLKNNTYTYNGKEYSLSRHGFARDHEFEVYQFDKESITFSLQSSSETFQNYPFVFELRITYLLTHNGLKVTYEVFNNNDFDMPFSIGGHPAFALGKAFEDYSLQFESDTTLKSYFLSNDLVSDDFQEIHLDEQLLKLTYSLFEKDALIIKELKSKSIFLMNEGETLLKFNFDDFPNFGIWTKEKAPFLCLEPWFGYSDPTTSSGNIMEKQGIQILKPNAIFNASFSIQV